MKKVFSVLIAVAVAAVLAAGAAAYAGYKITTGNTNLPNVYIGEINVGKMTTGDTVEALKTRGWDTRAAIALKVTIPGGQSFEVSPVEAGLILPLDDAAQKAHSYGRDGNIFENLKSYAQGKIDSVDINELYTEPNSDYINKCIDSGIAKLNEYMGTEEYTVDQQAETLSMKKGLGELELDKSGLYDAIVSAIGSGQTELSYTKLLREPEVPDFEKIHKAIEAEPAEAYFKDDNSFEVVDEIVGCKFSIDQAKKLWKDAQPGDEVLIPLEITRPKTTGDYLRSFLYRDLLGAMTTKFPNSNDARRNNLKLATSKLDGLIMLPGEEMSYNETVGVRTVEAGFMAAPAYVNGETKDEIGGGACQVASTLYAASLFAFLESTERECHYFAPNYMQMGTDATVTIPEDGGRAIDYKLKNSRNFPIKLVGVFDNENSTLTFEIWGTLTENDYMPVEFDNSVEGQFDYDRFIDPAYPEREGYKIKLTCEIYGFTDDNGSGYRTTTHRKVFDAEGNLVEDQIVNLLRDNGQHSMDTYYHHE